MPYERTIFRKIKMSDFQELLDLVTSGGVGYPNVKEAKKASLPSLQEKKAESIAALKTAKGAFDNVISDYTQEGQETLSEVERDLQTMDPFDLNVKYGSEAAALTLAQTRATTNIDRIQEQKRTIKEKITDSVAGAATAFVSGGANIGALAAGLVDDELGVNATEVAKDINISGDRLISDKLSDRREIQSITNQLSQRDNAAQLNKDIEADGHTIANLRRIGNDFLDTLDNSFDDSAIVGDITTSAAGSLLSGSVISSGVRKAGKGLLGHADDASRAFGKAAAMPTVIAAQESGSVYQQTVTEALAQLETNTELTEEEKYAKANAAGLKAAAIQAPVAAATGLLTSKFEAKPFKFDTLRKARSNIGREGVEETIQSGSGQLSQNIAIQDKINSEQSLSEGVGSEAAVGLIGGVASAGALQAPSVTLAGPKVLATAAVNQVSKRFKANLKNNQKAAVVPDRAMETAVSDIVTNSENVKEEINTVLETSDVSPEIKEETKSYINDLFDVAKFNPETIKEDIDPVVREIITETNEENINTKFEVLKKLSDIVTDTDNHTVQQISSASRTLFEMVRDDGNALVQQFSKTLEAIPEDHALLPVLRKYENILGNIQNSQTINKALLTGKKLVEKVAQEIEGKAETISKPADIKKAESKTTIDGAIDVAQQTPTLVDPDVNDQILKHAKDGLIELSDSQKLDLRTSRDIVKAAKAAKELSSKLALPSVNRVTNEMLTDIRDKNSKTGKPKSALAHMNVIVDSVRQGDVEQATSQLQNFINFAEVLQNQVNSINEAMAKGVGISRDISFTSRSPGSTQTFTQNKKIHLNNVSSIQLFQRIGVEAEAVTQVANSMAKLFPRLGIKPLKINVISPVLNQPAQGIVDTFSLPEQKESNEKVVKEEPAAEPVVEEVKEPAPKVGEETNNTQQAQPETQKEYDENTIKNKKLQGIDKLYPNLYGVINYFKESFKTYATPRTRTQGQDSSPLDIVKDVVSDPGRFNNFVGEKTKKHNFTKDISRTYSKFLTIVPSISKAMDESLKAFVTKNKKRLLANEPVADYINGRALNITEQDEKGNFTYNTELQETAILAALQWWINADQITSNFTEENIADFTDVDVESVNLFGLENIKAGVTDAVMKRSLAQEIIKYWGLQANNDASESYTQGIAESVAGEVILAFIELGYIVPTQIDINKQTDDTVKTNKKLNWNVFDEFPENSPIKTFPSVIEHIVMIDPEETNFIGEPPTNVSQTQLRNSSAPLTSQQKAAQKAEQQTKHYLNIPIFKLYRGMGSEGILKLAGLSDLKNRKLNDNHRKTLESRALTIVSAFDHLMNLYKEMENISPDNIGQLAIYYRYEFSSVNRMQMQGRHNPQASKLVREAILPTRSIVDLSNPETKDFEAFGLALAQAFGIKIEKQSRKASVDQIITKLENEFPKSLEILHNQIDNASETDGLTPQQIDIIVAENKGEPLDFVAFHALAEYSRWQNTSGNGRKSFETNLYVEADGVSNGAMNAMATLTSDTFSGSWLENMAKGGMFWNNITVMAEQKAKDLYKTGSDILSNIMTGTVNEEETGKSKQKDAFMTLMGMFSQDFQFNSETNEITIERGLMKNPMTIIIYGSGKRGIANKITKNLLDEIYERFSIAAQKQSDNKDMPLAMAMFGDASNGDAVLANKTFKEFEIAFATLKNNHLINKNSQFYVIETKKLRNGYAPKQNSITEFTFDDYDFRAVQSTVLETFVEPLQLAVEITLAGNMLGNAETIRKITQVQSIFAEYQFRAKVIAAMDKDRKTFLSKNELEKIRKDIIAVNPLVSTKNQNLYVPGNSNVDIDNNGFGRPFTDKFRTDAYVYGPSDSGVAGIPYSVISIDGQMMQTAATMKDAPEGTLKVFDGMHMKLSSVVEDSQKINQAAYEAWLVNPMEAIHKSYSSFLSSNNFNDTLKALPKKLQKDFKLSLIKAIFGLDAEIDSHNANSINKMMAVLETTASESAASVSARQEVMKKYKLHIDQMAGMGASYKTDGALVVEATDFETMADELNKQYEIEKDKITKQEADIDISKSLQKVGRVDKTTGARILSNTAIIKLKRLINIPTDQANVLNDILKSLTTKGYKVIFGTPDQVNAYAVRHNNRTVTVNDGDQGATLFSDKVIYLYNPSSETLIHELIHAATYEKVVDVYEGNDLGTNKVEQVKAVERIEELMKQFLVLDPTVIQNMDGETQKSYFAARGTIIRETNNITISEALSKANALNEFMAWGLSNDGLIKATKSTKVKNPLVALVQSVIAGIKKLVWGRKIAPKPQNDLFTNLRFNTNILMQTQKTPSERFNETILYQNTTYGQDDRMVGINEKISKKITRYIGPSSDITQTRRTVEKETAFRLAGKIGRAIAAQGFPMTAQEKTTFESIVAVMATATELDGNALSRANELFVHAEKNLTVEDFMVGLEGTDEQRRFTAQERYNSILGNSVSKKDKKGRSSLLPAFVALATTSEAFREVLARIDMPKFKVQEGDTLDIALENIGATAMNNLSVRMSGEDRNSKNVIEAIDSLTNRMVEIADERKTFLTAILGPIGKAIDKTNGYIVDSLTTAAEKGVKIGESLSEQSNNRVTKLVGDTIQIISSLADEKTAAQVAENTLSVANKSTKLGWKHALFVEFIGRTKSNAAVYDQIKTSSSAVQQDRQEFREHLPKMLQKKFTRKLNDAEWTSMFHALGKTDLASLLDIGSFTKTGVLDVIKDETILSNKITELEETIQGLDNEHTALIVKKSKQLATYMGTGVTGSNLLRNAVSIAHLLNETTAKRGTPSAALVTAINQLVTLYAIDNLDKNTKEIIVDLATNEGSGISFTVDYLVSQRNTENRKARLAGAKFNHYKGYIPTEAKRGSSLVISNDNDAQHLLSKGYVRVGNYEGSSAERGTKSKGYYYLPVSALAAYNQGIMQNVRQTASGVDLVSGFTYGTMTAGRITDPGQVTNIQRQLANGRKEHGLEKLMPVFGDNKLIIAYERSVDPKQLERLGNNTHLGEVMGIWEGRQVEEFKAGASNRNLIDSLKSMYDKEKNQLGKAAEYIDLLNPKVAKQYNMQDALGLITDDTKEYIEQVFGEKFMVRKDMLNDAFGYRQFSLREAWDAEDNALNKPALRYFRNAAITVFGKDAYRKVVTAEETLQSFVTDAKLMIVIKSVVVPVANLMANVYQMASRGISLHTIARELPKKTAEIDSYVRTRVRLLDLQAELRAIENNPIASRKLNVEIQTIKDGHKRLSIWPLIEAGEFSSISDASVTKDEIALSSGRLGEYVEGLVSKLPQSVKTAGRYAWISRDTALFQGLQRAIEYGDFLGKAIVYDELTKRKGKTQAEGLAAVTEEFVNYDRLPGRARGYAESVGAMWFWHFKIRTTKVALSIMRNNPLHVLLASLAPEPTFLGDVGMPTEDNFFTVLADGRLPYSIGPGQGFRSFALNPWINVTT